jgi:hypothetical protein
MKTKAYIILLHDPVENKYYGANYYGGEYRICPDAAFVYMTQNKPRWNRRRQKFMVAYGNDSAYEAATIMMLGFRNEHPSLDAKVYRCGANNCPVRVDWALWQKKRPNADHFPLYFFDKGLTSKKLSNTLPL